MLYTNKLILRSKGFPDPIAEDLLGKLPEDAFKPIMLADSITEDHPCLVPALRRLYQPGDVVTCQLPGPVHQLRPPGTPAEQTATVTRAVLDATGGFIYEVEGGSPGSPTRWGEAWITGCQPLPERTLVPA